MFSLDFLVVLAMIRGWPRMFVIILCYSGDWNILFAVWILLIWPTTWMWCRTAYSRQVIFLILVCRKRLCARVRCMRRNVFSTLVLYSDVCLVMRHGTTSNLLDFGVTVLVCWYVLVLL